MAGAAFAGCAAPAGRIKGTAVSSDGVRGQHTARCGCCQRGSPNRRQTLCHQVWHSEGWHPQGGIGLTALAAALCRVSQPKQTVAWRSKRPLPRSRPRSRPPPITCTVAAPCCHLSTHQGAHWRRQAGLQRPWLRASSWLKNQARGGLSAQTRPLSSVVGRSPAYWQPGCVQTLSPGHRTDGAMAAIGNKPEL